MRSVRPFSLLLVVLLAAVGALFSLWLAWAPCRACRRTPPLPAKRAASQLIPTALARKDFLAFLSDEHLKQTVVLPRLTAIGVFPTLLPGALKAALLEEFRLRRAAAAHTNVEADPALVAFASEAARPEMTWLTGSQAEAATRTWLAAALAQWCGALHLDHEATYGVRTYKRGSKLQPHVDRFATHVVSAIVHLRSEALQTPWPLEVLPHDAAYAHAVTFDADMDCLFYESATVPHGRLQPLDGEEYSNLFFHFSPPAWKGTAVEKMAAAAA